MLIRLASDLHLEGYSQMGYESLVNRFLPYNELDEQSVLVLAGDISSRLHQLISFLQIVETRFKKVIYVPGNHEYYGSDYLEWNALFEKEASNRLKNTSYACGTVETLELEDISFHFCTLWADGGHTLQEQFDVQHGLMDFRRISFQGTKFTVSNMQAINWHQLSILNQSLASSSTQKNVVVTHHLPSHSLCHPRFGSSINGGFASNALEELELEHPSLWLFGHTHDTVDTELFGTRVVANPAGYGTETNKSKFNTFQSKFILV